jgi:hypothetical protein
MKIENQKIAAQSWAGISARGLALLVCPSGTVAQPAHASRHGARARRGHRTVVMQAAARWRGRPGLIGGSHAARSVA